MTKKERLEERENLLKEKRLLTDKIKEIDKKLVSTYYAETPDEVRERIRQKDIKDHACAVCAYRDPLKDFFIPDGIVCRHPSNQEGKNWCKFCKSTCEHWKNEDEKKTVILIVGPSGSGKTTLVNHMHNVHDYPFVCSYTTRKMRDGEVSGVDHIFVSEDEMPEQDKMIAYTLFGGNHYWATHDQIKDKPTLYVIDEDGVRYFNERFGYMYNTVNVYIDRSNADIDEERKNRDLARKEMGNDFRWDLRISNDGTLEELLEKASKLIMEKAPL